MRRIGIVKSRSFVVVSCGIGLLLGKGVGAQDARPAAEQESNALEEIVITAQKRSEDLQKTPLTVQVVSEAELTKAAITQVDNLRQLLAGVEISNSANAQGGGVGGSRDTIVIRGVAGATGGDPSIQPSVAEVFDGIYSQSGVGGAGGFFDLAQVELIKGPQGTLYGRNATTGLVLFNTQRPKFENSGKVSVNMGNYSRITGSGVVNFMVDDTLAVRLAGQSSKHAGYFQDGLGNEDNAGARLKVLYQPSESLSFLLSTNYLMENGLGNPLVNLDNSTGKPVGNPWSADGPNAVNAAIFGPFYGKEVPHQNYVYNVIPEAEWDFGAATATLVLGYVYSQVNELNQTYQGAYRESKEKSAELRFASNNDNARFKWMAGLYYYDQNVTGYSTVICSPASGAIGPLAYGGRPEQYNLSQTGPIPTTPAFVAGQGPCGASLPQYNPSPTAIVTLGLNNDQLNYAAFTQDTFSITDALRVTGGLRWQYEKATRAPTSDAYYSGTLLIPSTPAAPNPATSQRAFGAADWTATTWRFGVDYDVAPQSLLYAAVATGWKSGTPQQFAAPYDTQKPERLTAYTFGSKNRFFGGTVQANAEVFYWLYQDRQVNITVPFGVVRYPDGTFVPGIPFLQNQVFVAGNASKSHVQGISADLAWRPFVSDTFTLAGEYLDENVHDDMGGRAVNGCLFECQASYAPELSVTASWAHDFDFGDRGVYSFDARTKYVSDQILSIAADKLTVETGRLSYTQPAYWMSNLGLSYTPFDARWNVRAYVNNVEDKVVKASATVGTTALRLASATLMPPRTFGVQLEVKF